MAHPGLLLESPLTRAFSKIFNLLKGIWCQRKEASRLKQCRCCFPGKKEIDRCLALLAKYICNFQVCLKIPDQI